MLRQEIESMLESCRDSLARLEEEYATAEDAGAEALSLDRLQRLVVAYARLVAPLREYLEQEKTGARNPMRLATKIDAFIHDIETLEADAGLHPTKREAAELAMLARGLERDV